MAAISTAAEYSAIREAIQKLSTLDADGKRRDVVTVSAGGLMTTYSSSRLPELQAREILLARRLSVKNTRKRVTPDFSAGGSDQDWSGP